MLSLVEQKNGGIACHQDFLAQSVEQRWGLRCEMSCYQAVYTKKTPLPEVEGISILPLDESDWELVVGHYDKIEVDDIKKTLRESRLFGAFLEEKPVGFIGEHKEGGMGMLEVFTPYRRMGIAMALESWFINRTLEKGHIPFGQIVTDNEASLGLQKKLGLRLSREKIYWFFPKS